jgi:hypothetical protein
MSLMMLPFVVGGILGFYCVKMRRLAQGPHQRWWSVIGFLVAYAAPYVSYLIGIASHTPAGFYRAKAVSAELAVVRKPANLNLNVESLNQCAIFRLSI